MRILKEYQNRHLNQTKDPVKEVLFMIVDYGIKNHIFEFDKTWDKMSENKQEKLLQKMLKDIVEVINSKK